MATRNFHWSSVFDCVMHETDGAGATTVEYTHEPGEFGPLVSETRSGVESYHHYDALGSTTFLSDTSGNLTDTFQYDAWGNEVIRTGTTPTPYKWVGRWGYQQDTPTGGYYIRERSYQPTVARWVSVDPLPRQDTNLYVYSHNSPCTYIDPSGLGSFVSLWSRGGDDEERPYETAFIVTEVLSDESDCHDNWCQPCVGDVSFKLHYHARITGAFLAPLHFTFGLCYQNIFTLFNIRRHNPPIRDSAGYPIRAELEATIDLAFLKCAGDFRQVDVYATNRAGCGGQGRVAEEINIHLSVSECGNSFATTEITEYPAEDGQYNFPIRCVSCGEPRYPIAPPM